LKEYIFSEGKYKKRLSNLRMQNPDRTFIEDFKNEVAVSYFNTDII